MPQSNDALRPVPFVPVDVPALEFDFPGLSIGVAEYAEGPTGCTVVAFDRPRQLAVDVRGGAPGCVGQDYPVADAICLAGGSLHGLEAAFGVSAELFARRDYSAGSGELALVPGAIIHDFGRRTNTVYPDKELGRAALRAARSGWFPLGARGAGCSAGCGAAFRPLARSEPSGQGAAFRQIGLTRLAAFTVVNALGGIVDRAGRVVRGFLDPTADWRLSLDECLVRAAGQATEPPPGNTTLTVVVTNQRLSYRELTQLGRQVHASMARAIQPFHGLNDGDVLFAVSTADVDNPALPPTVLGALASEVVWDAVLSAASAA